ncbi:MAG: hypothetical protein Q8R44_00835 [Novosphingobium sp.]|nr:hypothetical protein [Novosphingobium sp.]
MNKFLKVAVAFAALAAISPALAETDRAGNREIVTRPAPGPSRSGLVAPVRVPNRDSASAMADCDCPMMKASASDCMMGMPGKRTSRSNG